MAVASFFPVSTSLSVKSSLGFLRLFESFLLLLQPLDRVLFLMPAQSGNYQFPCHKPAGS